MDTFPGRPPAVLEHEVLAVLFPFAELLALVQRGNNGVQGSFAEYMESVPWPIYGIPGVLNTRYFGGQVSRSLGQQ